MRLNYELESKRHSLVEFRNRHYCLRFTCTCVMKLKFEKFKNKIVYKFQLVKSEQTMPSAECTFAFVHAKKESAAKERGALHSTLIKMVVVFYELNYFQRRVTHMSKIRI